MGGTPGAGTATEATVTISGLRLSYVDFGRPGAPVLALHGHFGRARMFAPLAAALAPEHRVVALEQRGHGRSESSQDAGPDAYVADAAAFLRALDLAPVTVLGHSMGGVVAYRLAARHPELVHTLIIEEASAVVTEPVLDVSDWPRRTATLRELRAAVESRGIPDAGYFLESAVEDAAGRGFLFDYRTMMASQRALLGDYWADWLGSSCPALLVHGRESGVLPTAVAREMATRRPATELVELPRVGHFVRDEDPDGFARAARDFLADPDRVRHETG